MLLLIDEDKRAAVWIMLNARIDRVKIKTPTRKNPRNESNAKAHTTR